MKKEKNNWKDTYRGVVHLGMTGGGDEFTLCGLAYDEPASEHGADVMEVTSAVANCHDCISTAMKLMPYLEKEMKRVTKAGKSNRKKYTCVKCGLDFYRSQVRGFSTSCSVRTYICKQCANEEEM